MNTATRSVAILIAIAAIGGAFYWLATHRAQLPSSTTVSNSPYTIEVEIGDTSISTNDEVRLTFTVRNEGKIADIYSEDKVVHYVIASENSLDFFHTFTPEVKKPGIFYIDHTFTQPGRYRIWTELVDTHKGKELHHNQNAELVSYVELAVTGRATQAIVPITQTTAEVGPYQVIYQVEGLKANQPTNLTMHVRNSTGQTVPVFAEEPAIYVMVGPDFSFMSHTHTKPALPNNRIGITETFPTAGNYLFWTEVYAQEGDHYAALQVPFMLKVAP